MNDTEKWGLLAQTSATKAVSELADKTREESHKITNELGVAYMAEVVSQLGSDAAAELLRALPTDFSQQIIAALPADKAKDIREILSHPEGTAGAVMAKEYLHVPSDMTIADAIEYLHLIPKEKKGKIPYVYAHDAGKRLEGVIQTKDLVFNPLDTPIREIMNAPVVSVNRNTSQQDLAKIFQEQRYLAVPVVDDDQRLVGVVPADNMLLAVKEQADKDIAKIVGTDAEEMKTHSVPKIMRLRLPWLFVNIVSGLFCAFIAGLFEHGIEEVTALFLFIPVVLGLSESTGIQGATIVVRNLTLGSVRFKDFGPLFFREIVVGLLIGLVCGLIVGAVTSIWQGNQLLGLAIGISLNVAIVISALIGLLLPMVFKTLKVDPAIASGPLVLAICDIQTLFVYFNLASYILSR